MNSKSETNDATVQVSDLTIGSVPRHILRLTSYMMLGLLTLMGANLIEAIYIAKLCAHALAALSFTFPLIMLFQAIAMGLAIGASSVVARTMGAGDVFQAKRLISHCLLLVVLLISSICLITYPYVGLFLAFLGADPETLVMATNFIQLWMFGLPFFTIAIVSMNLMRASGNAKTPGILMAIGSLLHVSISPLFIFGLLGLPKLGLQGAAVGFLIARTISFLMYFYVMVYREKLVVAELSGFVHSCKEILHVGLPAIASNLIQPISLSIITKLLAVHGALVVAGFGVASRIESVIIIVIVAQSMSVAPFVGQNSGANKVDRIKLGLGFANKVSLLWGVFAYLTLFFSARIFVSSINSDTEVIEVAVKYLTIVPLSIGFMGIIMNSTSCFNALGKPMPPLFLSVLQMLVVLIPLAYIGNYFWGYTGIFVASAVTVLLLSAVSWFWIKKMIETDHSKTSI